MALIAIMNVVKDDDRCRINTTPTTGFTWTSDLVVEPPPPPPLLLLLLLLLLLITSHTMPATATVFITNVSLLLSKVRQRCIPIHHRARSFRVTDERTQLLLRVFQSSRFCGA